MDAVVVLALTSLPLGRVAGSNVFVYLDRYILGVGDRIDAYSLKVLVVI